MSYVRYLCEQGHMCCNSHRAELAFSRDVTVRHQHFCDNCLLSPFHSGSPSIEYPLFSTPSSPVHPAFFRIVLEWWFLLILPVLLYRMSVTHLCRSSSTWVNQPLKCTWEHCWLCHPTFIPLSRSCSCIFNCTSWDLLWLSITNKLLVIAQ